MTRLKIYFDTLPEGCIYKCNWIKQLIKGIQRCGELLELTGSIETCNIIACISDRYNILYNNNKSIIDNQTIKFIIISFQDSSIEDHGTFYNNNILLVLDHCKDLNVKNKKILCALNTQNRFQFNDNVLPIKDREYDIIFFGKIKCGGEYQKHREDLVQSLEQFSKKYPQFKIKFGNTIKYEDYLNYLKNSKILLSPYGFGVWSLKDYESVCNGTHVIKPDIFYECYPNYYQNMDHYYNNNENIEKKLLNCLNNLDEVQLKVDKNRQLYLSYNLKDQIKMLEDNIQKHM